MMGRAQSYFKMNIEVVSTTSFTNTNQTNLLEEVVKTIPNCLQMMPKFINSIAQKSVDKSQSTRDCELQDLNWTYSYNKSYFQIQLDTHLHRWLPMIETEK